MGLASAKRTAAALVAVLAGGTLAACGPHGTIRSAPAVSAPRTAAATTPSPTASPSASASGSRALSASGSGTPSASATSPTAPGTPTGSASGATSAPAPLRGGSMAGGSPGNLAQGDGGAAGSEIPASIDYGVQDRGAAVALTFDDGPDPRWTPQILALLAQHHAKATFCEIGPNAQRYPYLVKQITATGDRLCDHSVHHDEQQSRKPLGYNIHEIADAQQEISAAAGPGAKLWYYRAPGGDFSPQIRSIAAQHGLRPLGWTVDANDWRRPGVDGIMQNINKDLQPGAIILMHDGGGDRTQTIQALARLLNQLDAQGYAYSFPTR